MANSVASAASAEDLDRILSWVCELTRIDRILWNMVSAGCRLGVLPPGVDEPRIVADFVHEARLAVRRLNPTPPPGVRLVFHEGAVAVVDGEFTGPVVRTARSLCGLAELSSSAALTVALSGPVYEDVTAFGGESLRSAPFWRFVMAEGVVLWVAAFPAAGAVSHPDG